MPTKTNEFREERLNSSIKEIVGEFLEREVALAGTLLTVTRIIFKDNATRAQVFVTVYPESKEKETIKAIEKSLRSLRLFVKEKIKTRIIPFFEFRIDAGEKNRERVEELLRDHV